MIYGWITTWLYIVMFSFIFLFSVFLTVTRNSHLIRFSHSVIDVGILTIFSLLRLPGIWKGIESRGPAGTKWSSQRTATARCVSAWLCQRMPVTTPCWPSTISARTPAPVNSMWTGWETSTPHLLWLPKPWTEYSTSKAHYGRIWNV